MTLTTAQLALRRQGIGASEVAAVLGLDSYRTPFDVWYDKTQRDAAAPRPEPTDGPAFWGHRFERLIATVYQERQPMPVELRESGTIVGPESWMLATPDRFVHRLDVDLSWLLEIKSKSDRAVRAGGWGEPGTDQVPDEILTQVAWQMGITGEERADVALLVTDVRELRIFTVRHDADLFASLVDRVGEWWHRHVIGGEAPPMSGGSATEYVKRRFPKAGATVREATQGEYPLLARYALLKTTAKDAEAELKVLTPQVQALIGADKGIAHPELGRVTWSDTKGRAATDWEALARALGATDEQIQQYTRIGAGYRQMRFTPAKGDEE